MVGFSKTLARYRVSEWHTMYIDYETLKTYVNETKRKREEIMTPGTTSADDQSVYGRDSVDDSQWSRYATAPTLATELEERESLRANTMRWNSCGRRWRWSTNRRYRSKVR